MTTTGPRSTRRRLLLLAGLLPCLVLLAVSLRTGWLLAQHRAGVAAFDQGRYDEARDHFAANRVLNPVSRWVAPFNEGAAEHRGDEAAAAVTDYRTALPLAPEPWQCVVRTNLALALEDVGVDEREQGRLSEAAHAWAAGRRALAPCLDPDPDPDDAQSDDAEPDDAEDDDQETDGNGSETDSEADSETDSEEVAPLTPGADAPDPGETRERATRVDRRLRTRLADQPEAQRPAPSPSPPLDAQRRAELDRTNQSAREQRQSLEDARERRQARRASERSGGSTDVPSW